MGRFFNITVKPTIKASDQHIHAFAAHDAYHAWHAFDIPKGGFAIKGATVLVRGVDGAAQTARAFALYFAHPSLDGTAPTALGTPSATMNGIGYFNNLVGAIDFQSTSTAVNANLDYMSVYTSGLTGSTGQHVHLTVEGRPHLTKDGYNTLYMAIAGGAGNTWDFSTAVVTSRSVDVSALDAAELVNADIEGTDPRKVFAPGDIIHAEDDIIVGEVKSMADANTITFKANGEPGESSTDYSVPANLAAWKIQNGADAAGDLASGDELYNIHPITVILHCEQ
tara:strand:+ start:1255 stop:2097 length:843 start_codon:yes stop_codon:yes gene_type:complete